MTIGVDEFPDYDDVLSLDTIHFIRQLPRKELYLAKEKTAKLLGRELTEAEDYCIGRLHWDIESDYVLMDMGR